MTGIIPKKLICNGSQPTNAVKEVIKRMTYFSDKDRWNYLDLSNRPSLRRQEDKWEALSLHRRYGEWRDLERKFEEICQIPGRALKLNQLTSGSDDAAEVLTRIGVKIKVSKPAQKKNFLILEVKGATFQFVYFKGGKVEIGMDMPDVRKMVKKYEIFGRPSSIFHSWPKRLETVSPFWVQNVEVNALQYAAITGRRPESSSKDNEPLTNISKKDADEFMTQLNRFIKGRGYNFTASLPTEEQFEYLAQKIKIKKDEKIDCGKMQQRSVKGSKGGEVKNLMGNNWEWTTTPWKPYLGNTISKFMPKGEDVSSYVVRGGCKTCLPENCLPQARWSQAENHKSDWVSFRIVLKKNK